jgi:hypothetical protein
VNVPTKRAQELVGSDTQFVEEMASLARRHKADRDIAKKAVLSWMLILAALDGTNLSGVLERFARSAPSRRDQERLVTRLRERIEAEQ